MRTSYGGTDKSKTASKKFKAEGLLVASDDVVRVTFTPGPVARSNMAVTVSPAKNTPPLSHRALAPEGQEEDCHLSRMLSFGSVDSSLCRLDSHDSAVALSRIHSLLPPPPPVLPTTKAKSTLQAPQDAGRA